ncbi:MAG: polyamine ABC transporter substrate-binding protein [Rhodospirillales bacterium]|nr:polyamine ABC transporter substrate-binding protein [Rhodospirillales bacterium]
MIRWFVTVLSALTVLLVAPAPTPAAEEPVVRVFNWSDYIDDTVLTDFTRDTGIKVVYDVYDSNDVLETKLLAGNSGYDLVFPSANFLARQIKAGVFAEIDQARIGNWKQLDEKMMQRVARFDPGNAHAAIYLWGTSGIAYNEQMIRARMADAPVDSWRMIFDPEVVKRFADCGIYMLNAPDEMIPAALNYIGEDPDSKDPEVIAKAENVLMAVRPYIRKFHSSETINALANGDICLAVMWSGDAGIAASRAKEAGKAFDIEYVIPKEGAQMWFDMMAIPKDAPHPQNARALVDYILKPEMIARITNFVTYPNAVPASLPLIDPEIANNPMIYPPPEVKDRLFVVSPNDQRTQRILTRLWQKVLTGA